MMVKNIDHDALLALVVGVGTRRNTVKPVYNDHL